ncbi:uncharacterized protein LOC129596620 [Paramacrobiotus metropolitanus]|uniref:uncharacterized protein LOC129596620 n=1 Tax=Paramacrobiotus metropolitanus TaxID=2943436 RepID=UPI0024463E92|nr:uncharacterized protein LOC129596620 [Paramacrobiotus metropolitanus]
MDKLRVIQPLTILFLVLLEILPRPGFCISPVSLQNGNEQDLRADWMVNSDDLVFSAVDDPFDSGDINVQKNRITLDSVPPDAVETNSPIPEEIINTSDTTFITTQTTPTDIPSSPSTLQPVTESSTNAPNPTTGSVSSDTSTTSQELTTSFSDDTTAAKTTSNANSSLPTALTVSSTTSTVIQTTEIVKTSKPTTPAFVSSTITSGSTSTAAPAEEPTTPSSGLRPVITLALFVVSVLIPYVLM